MPENSTAKVLFPKWKKIAKNQLLQTWAFTQQLNFQSYFMPINPIVASLREKKKTNKKQATNTRALSTPSAFSMLSTFEKSDLNLYSLIGSKYIFWRKCAWCYFSDKRTGEKSVIMVIWNWVSSMPKYTWLFLPVIHHFVLGCVCARHRHQNCAFCFDRISVLENRIKNKLLKYIGYSSCRAMKDVRASN